MATRSSGAVRLAGVILALCAAALLGFGVYLTCLALNWPMPNWVPAQFRVQPAGPELVLAALSDSLVGKAAAYLLVFAGIAGLNGVWMLILGRRNRVLVGLLLALFLIFVGVGLWASLTTTETP